MGFTQISFLFLFMPLSILVYFAAYRAFDRDIRVCNTLLICDALIFYWWAEPKLLLFFVSLTLLMYILGIAISRLINGSEKQLLMFFSIIIFSFLLLIYKYLPAVKILTKDEQAVIMPLFTGMLVPVGIAFFVLGAISYLLDVYIGKAKPGSITDVFVYAMFFPKAVCGPVVLWRDFSPQIHERTTDLDKVTGGIKRIIIGYAKKAIIADTFAAQIALIDAKMSANATDSLTVWLLGILYFFRIYYDFSGYSDIAIGLSGIFGFDVGENFNRPYLSGSVTDFWRRWHISLGRWFREYLYIPLGGNRSGVKYFNILITFMVAALWHGWKLNILLWGVLNGLLVVSEKYFRKSGRQNRMPRYLSTILAMAFICFGWMLFRAADLTTAFALFKALFVSPGGTIPNFTWRFFLTKRAAIFIIIAAAGAFGLFDRVRGLIKTKLDSSAYELFANIMLLLLFATDIMFVISNSYTPFMFTLIP